MQQQLHQQLDQYQCQYGKHYDEEMSTVDAVLCHHFGKSTDGNWYRERPTDDQMVQFREWKDEFKTLDVLDSAVKESDWCEGISESWPNENYENELEWFTNKAKDLLPTHQWNVASTAVSLCCFFIWLCFSPHQGPGAEMLDRTCACCHQPFVLLTK